MPLHTIGLLELVVRHTESGKEVHVSNFGPDNRDLLDEIDEYFEAISGRGGVSFAERYFTTVTNSRRPKRRDIRTELDYGRYGSDRRIREVNGGRVTGAVKKTEVASDGLRFVSRVPKNGMIALVGYELVGISSAAGLFTRDFIAWFQARHIGYQVDIDYLEDSDAWTDFLDGAQLKELTFVAYKGAKNNRAGRPTKEYYDVVPGRRGDVLPRAWLDSLMGKGLPANQVLSVSVNEDDIKETHVVVSKDGRRRTIAIGAAWPRFTWEVVPESNTRPIDSVFFKVVDGLIKTRLNTRGITD